MGRDREAIISFIQRLDTCDQDAILSLGSSAVFRSGDHVFREGEVAGSVALLINGCVKICGTARNGRNVLLALRDAGDLVGQLPALDDSATRPSSAIAIADVEARIVSRTEFRDFLLHHPRATYVLMQELSRDLTEALRQGKVLGSEGTLGRVVERLLELADRYGAPTPGGGVRIALHLSQADVAAWIGGSREAVVRALASLRARGLITTQRRTIVIRDLDALRSDICVTAGV